MARKGNMDLTKGSVTKNLLLFAIPIILSNILQHLYTAADRAVVGQFAENATGALAAVGSTNSAITLLLGLTNGLAVGVNIVCANLRGARDEKGLQRSMHTSMVLSVLCGAVLMAVGILVARPMLIMMSVPESVLDLATLYMRIYFCGVPASLVYNFGAAILRSNGDTRRPMVILGVSGVVNVVLNLVLVIFCHMSVEGVAIATVASQVVSAVWICGILFSREHDYKLAWRSLRLHKQQTWNVIKIGVPCGINGMAFSVSNLILQSTVNTFGEIVIAGNVAADSVGGLIYQVLVGFYTACVSFAGQNYGAGKIKNIDKGLVAGCILSAGIVLALGIVALVFAEPLLRIFNTDPAVVAAGVPKLGIYCYGYCVFAASEVLLGCLRGMRKTAVPSAINVLCVCVFRVVWVWAVFPLQPTIEMLYACYPISWVLSGVGLLIAYLHYRKKLFLVVENVSHHSML